MRPPLIAPLVIVAALGCHDQPFGPSTARGLALALELAKTSVPQGDPDTITVTLTNTNPYAVSLEAGACALLAYVTDADGVTVFPSGGNWYCIMILRRLTLAPGESEAAPFVLDTHSLPAGVYSAYGTFSADGIQLRTPPATIQVN
jgi:hypothetical protein